MKKENIELGNLGAGAAAELFQVELERVIANIMDPNTKPDAMRSITLKLTVKPDKKSRTMCGLAIDCTSKLAPSLPFESHMFVGLENGKPVSSEYNPKQGLLPVEEEKTNEAKLHIIRK